VVRRDAFAPTGSAGFTLLEVLVALVILGLVVGASATVMRNGVASHSIASDVDTALAIANSRLAAAGVTHRLREGVTAGTVASRFHWQESVAPYKDPATHAPDAPEAFRLYRVAVAVAWPEGAHRRRLVLATLRLARVTP
jgi:general secretion pathway protein I